MVFVEETQSFYVFPFVGLIRPRGLQQNYEKFIMNGNVNKRVESY